MASEVPKTTLNNGVQMPMLGFGVYQIPVDETEQAVADALSVGYRALDTAESYGNEEAVGRAIAQSGIARDELFVTTKLWIHSGEEAARRAFAGSLERLGLDYVDLYLIHQPLGDYYGSWRAMQELNREGLAKAIGVSNFYPDRLVDLIDHNEVTPAVNQIETHPYNQRRADQEIMREHGVQHESWGPFAEGKNNLFSDPILRRDRRGARQVGRPGRVALADPARRRRDPEVRPHRADAREHRRLRLRAHRRGDGAHRGPRHRHDAVLRPRRSRHGQLAQQPPWGLTVPERKKS